MRRGTVRMLVVGFIALLLGGAVTAAGVWAIPNSGSAPSIFDDFSFSSTGNGFWHVNAIGARAEILNGRLTLAGNTIELDRRIQTDPFRTIVVARMRGLRMHKFALGLGVFHSGTISLEFDSDGVKCGRGTDQGWQVDFVKPWNPPPDGTWYYAGIQVVNPYPKITPAQQAKLNAIDSSLWKPVIITCALWDASGRLLGSSTPTFPRPNAHYASFDEAYVRTWDSNNRYQLDWLYAGPPSGLPVRLRFPKP